MTATIANTAYPTPPTSTPSPSSPTEGSPWHNGSRAFLTASVPDLVSRLTKYEKIKLLAGADWWHTVPIHRLNIPGIKMTDGPNGARGASFAEMTAGLAIPCETALGATFAPEMVHRAASILAKETKDRGAVALLAPTINIQRSPLGGRAFESFSEDTLLSGTMAASYVKGLQQNGVSAVLKHFVCNDQEHERSAVSAEVSERALREVYLRPFMIAVQEANPLAIMTSYNRVNGTHVAESKQLLEDLLRREWAYDGMVMSDWFGTYSVDLGILAGQDLEMPGPAKWRTEYLVDHCLMSRKITERQIDARVEKILDWAQKLARLSPDVVYGDDVEVTNHDSQDQAFLRELAGSSMVLLKNKGNVLPITNKRARVAVIGPGATSKCVSGGGSAALNASYVVTVLDGLRAGAPSDLDLEYCLGTPAHKLLPHLDGILNEDGDAGCDLRLFANRDDMAHPDRSVRTLRLCDSSALISDDIPEDLKNRPWFAVMTGTWTAPVSGAYEFSLSVCGRARLFIDNLLVVDNWDILQRPGDGFFGQGTIEELGVVDINKGQDYQIRCEYGNVAGAKIGQEVKDESQPIHNFGLRVGGFPVVDQDRELQDAVAMAQGSDAVVLVVGLGPDFESEAFDRPDLSLPMRTNELIERVAAVNERTVVVIQSGSAVSMPWADRVAAIVQAWYGGNEAGNAIADVLYGRRNPSGRLPITFPKREEDVPAYTDFKSEKGIVHYSEGLNVGYKWYQARKIEPLFPFGHGLSYSTYAYSDLWLDSRLAPNEIWLRLSVTVTNTGPMSGSHSVQVYLCPPTATATSLYHPVRSLAGVGYVPDLAVGDTRQVILELPKSTLAHWDDILHLWTIERGIWRAVVAENAHDPPLLETSFEVQGVFEWVGL